nr:hypothetical protein [uncultured Sphingomonas sp.]
MIQEMIEHEVNDVDGGAGLIDTLVELAYEAAMAALMQYSRPQA